jgi:hypothetical protein
VNAPTTAINDSEVAVNPTVIAASFTNPRATLSPVDGRDGGDEMDGFDGVAFLMVAMVEGQIAGRSARGSNSRPDALVNFYSPRQPVSTSALHLARPHASRLSAEKAADRWENEPGDGM